MMNYYIISGIYSNVETIKSHLKRERKYAKSFNTETEFKKAISMEERGVVFVAPGFAYDLYELCGEISLHYPLLTVILIASNDEIDYKKAMYVGAVDIINVTFSQEEFREALAKAESIIELKNEELGKKTESAQEKKRVMTVVSTKGGVGKTTLSVNLAVAFVKKGLKVAILDLDLQFGDVPILLDVQPKQTIYEWLKESYESGDGGINKYLIKDPKTGVSILSAPLLPEFAELVTGEHISVIISELKKEFDIIIIDTPPSLNETSLVAIENSDDILLIAALDMPTLKNCKLAIDTLSLLGLKDKIKLILNRETSESGMTAATVEEILGMKLEVRIPSDYKTVIMSINLGKPFVVGASKTLIAKTILEFAEQLLSGGEKRKQGKKKRIFSFLHSK